MITRRTEGRAFRLFGPQVTAAFACAWVDAARRSGVRVACLAVLSNHYHAVVYDPEGKLADQLRDVHSVVTRFTNKLDDVVEHLWDAQRTHVEELLDAETVIEKMAYVMANPVRHRLVASPTAWPGLLTKVDEIGTGRGQRFARPEMFFADETAVDLVCDVPPMCALAYGVEGFRRRLQVAISAIVSGVATEARRDGRGFLGVEGVQQQGRMSRPATPHKRTAGKRADPAPQVAGANPAEVRAALARAATFRERYKACLERFKAGFRDVVFPAGTWLLCRFFGARCETDEPGLLAAA